MNRDGNRKCHVPLTLVLFLALLASGCGGDADRPKTVPVSGSVAYNGKPVENATVAFQCEGSPRAATGITDAEGKFTLSTFAINDGAVVGTHKITVTKDNPSAAPQVGADGKPPEAADQAATFEAALDAEKFKGLLPEKYSSQSTTPLSETVSETGVNEFVLQLKD